MLKLEHCRLHARGIRDSQLISFSETRELLTKVQIGQIRLVFISAVLAYIQLVFTWEENVEPLLMSGAKILYSPSENSKAVSSLLQVVAMGYTRLWVGKEDCCMGMRRRLTGSLNSITQSVVKFAVNHWLNEVEFLDLIIKIENRRLKTYLYRKPYLDYVLVVTALNRRVSNKSNNKQLPVSQ